MRGKAQFTKEEGEIGRKIARARIHVEWANERLKNFAILSHICQSYRPIVDCIIQVCCCLVNLQTPLLKEVDDISVAVDFDAANGSDNVEYDDPVWMY